MAESNRLHSEFVAHSARGRVIVAGIAFALAAAFSVSCATPPPAPLSPSEQLRRDGRAGLEIAEKFEALAEFRNDPSVVAYLNDLGKTLAESDPDLKEFEIRVRLVSRVSGAEKAWRNHAVPGARIYLSTQLLRTLNFENELAAALAFELGHIRARTLIRRFPESTGLFGFGSVFDFTEADHLAALEPAMEMLYRSGFDPRGMVSLLSRFQRDPGRSPFPQTQVSILLENARRIIALHVPLRNPIVRSERFLAIYQRIQKL